MNARYNQTEEKESEKALYVRQINGKYHSKTYYSHEALSQPPWFLAT